MNSQLWICEKKILFEFASMENDFFFSRLVLRIEWVLY